MFKLLLTTSLFLGLALAATEDHSSSHHASPQETTIVKFDKKSPPKFSSYMLTAIVELPNSDIFEPFAVFYDATKNRSRVDYRNGVVKTLQFGAESGNRMFSYVTTPAEAIVHRHPCYTFKGSEDRPILPQSAFPVNLDQYSYAGETAMSGIRVSQWHFEEFKDKKKRTFDFFTHSLTDHPIRYEFDEFDTRLDTFVDKQIIEYSFFVEVTPSDEMFELAEDFKCQELASYDDIKQMKRDKLTNLDQRIWLMNPLSEYFPNKQHHEHDLVDEKYEHFKRTYKTQYADEAENEKRKAIFRHNLRYIESSNRAGLSYRLALNHFADWTADELKKIRGFRASDKEGPLQGTKFDRSKHNIRRIDKLPDSLDVWLFGAVGPVADQKICGSDWAFAAKEAIEGAFFFKNGHLVRLAAQELVDCTRSVGNEGCDGGAHYRAYEWVKQHGLSAEQDYAPYVGAFGTCHYSEAPVTVTISDWLRLSNSSEDLRWALAGNGPVALAVDASHRSFLFYAGGIYSELKCKKSLEQGDVNHSLVAVGYGKLGGRDYFMLKNSWSSDWGNSGLILFDTDPERNCGLYSEMSQPLV